MDAADWVAVAGVVVTTTAVLVALFQEDIRRWRSRPDITASASVAVFPIRKPSSDTYVPHAYVRLQVSVERAKSQAQKLQVQLVACDPPARLGGVAPINATEYLIPLRWSFGHETFVDISPGGSRFVDVLEVHQDPAYRAILTTVPAPTEGQMLIAAQQPYNILVRIVGDNITPTSIKLSVLNNGTWDGTAGGLLQSLAATAYPVGSG